MITENGHIWPLIIGLHLGKCVNCGLRYGDYLKLRRTSELDPGNQEFKDRLKCKGDENEK